MLQSVTGNKTAGFTLLEIVAVIALIGLILVLAYPNINCSIERVEVGYIGRLVNADINRLIEESILEPTAAMVVTFNHDGYSFTIGEKSINRNFKYQFNFDLPKVQRPEDQNSPDNIEPQPTLNQAVSTSSPTEIASKKKPLAVASYKVTFINGQLSNDFQLYWHTTHFQGSLLLYKVGTLKWHYEKR